MQRQMLKSKIHRATVTACDVDYIGSISIDAELMRQADLLPNEQVHVWDVENGARIVTYAIEGEPGQIQVNGAAARLVNEGDKVIIVSYAGYDGPDLEAYAPLVVHVDERNRAVAVDSHPEVLLTGEERRS
jgi:aspartate 1-decarboxylase